MSPAKGVSQAPEKFFSCYTFSEIQSTLVRGEIIRTAQDAALLGSVGRPPEEYSLGVSLQFEGVLFL